MKHLRLYIDTSVVGGCFDPPFAEVSRVLFARARAGEITLLTSELMIQELSEAPAEVQAVFDVVPRESIEEVSTTPEAETLRDKYLEAGVVGPSSATDGLHVALATVSRADAIVSWNFRHIVHFEKIRGFNAVNLREGYAPLEIRSPREMVR